MQSTYELRIRPNRAWIKIDWRAIWEYRDLLFLLVRRDFVSKYKQTVLGPIWFIIQPLITTVVFTILFGNVAKISTDGLPPMLFYLSGTLGWNYFASNFGSTSTSLVGNAGLFGKVYFPRLIVPLSTVVSNLFTFGIQLGLLLAFWLYFKCLSSAGVYFGMHWEVLFLPLLLLQIAGLSLGVGLWVAALTAKYRDFAHLAGFLIQIWMYATPIIYPLSIIPEKWRWFVVLNPMTMPVEACKYMFLGQASVEPLYMLISIVVSVVILLSGLLVFQKIERTFVDTV